MRKSYQLRSLIVAALVFATDLCGSTKEKTLNALDRAKSWLRDTYNSLISTLSNASNHLSERLQALSWHPQPRLIPALAYPDARISRFLNHLRDNPSRKIVQLPLFSAFNLASRDYLAYKAPQQTAMTLTLPEPIPTRLEGSETLETASEGMTAHIKKGKRYYALQQPQEGRVHWYKVGRRYKRMIHPALALAS
jgi:hypothetical protein